MSIFISVVSHGHFNLIRKLNCLAELSIEFNVVVKINLQEERLIPYLKENGIHYIDQQYGLGFGHNNNVVFSYCKNKLGMKSDDIFIVFNPDVISDVKTINKIVNSMRTNMTAIAAINLFKDSDFSIPDNSVRKFPTFINFFKSFIGLENSTIIHKESIEIPTNIDWAAGSFLAFKASHYDALKGFDENYFMYCEDIDICYRSKQAGYPVTFFPNVKMQHLAEHANRSVFSKHFFWHIKSVLRFLGTRRGLTNHKSSLL